MRTKLVLLSALATVGVASPAFAAEPTTTTNKIDSKLFQQLGQQTVSAELHKQIKRLLALAVIEMTLPDKPSSRLQKYRLLDASLTKDDA